MSLPSPEAPDGQATLLSEMAPEESHIDLVLRPSRPSQGAIDEDIAQTDLDQTVVAPTEIEANHDAQSTFLPSQAALQLSHQVIGPNTPSENIVIQQALNLAPDSEAPPPLSRTGPFPNRLIRRRDTTALSAAIAALQQSMELRADELFRLSGLLFEQFEQTSEENDLTQTIIFTERALELVPDGCGDEARLLQILGSCLRCRFELHDELVDWDRAVESLRRAVDLTPDGHLDKASRFSDLGYAFGVKYTRFGTLVDLERAAENMQRAVDLTPDSHLDKAGRLTDLGMAYLARYNRFGKLVDLDYAIKFQQQALDLTPDGHIDKAVWLGFLGNHLDTRYLHLHELTDLTRAIENKQQAISLTPDNHPSKGVLLGHLGVALLAQQNTVQAVESLQRAIALTPDDWPDKATQLGNLGNALELRFRDLGNYADLEQSIKYHEQAVALAPDDFTLFSKLGDSLAQRFLLLGTLTDLDRAIDTHQQAVALVPKHHSVRAMAHMALGDWLVQRYRHTPSHTDLERALAAYSESAQSNDGQVVVRLRAAIQRAKLCTSDRQHFHPNTTIEAYTVVVDLVPRLTSPGRSILQKYSDMSLMGVSEVINDAVAEAVHCGMLELAFEWLEQSRSIIWSQVLQLRSPVEDLRMEHPEEAKKLEELSRALDLAATSDNGRTPQTPGADLPAEAAAKIHRRLGEQYEQLLEHIRALYGFSNFLKPKPFSDLREVASSAPVVVVSIHKKRCDALIIHQFSSSPTHVSLPVIDSFGGQILHRELAKLLRAADVLRHCKQHGGDELSASGSGEKERFLSLLEQIWEKIAEPVLGHLGYLRKPQNGRIPRVTWCLTGPLTFLPIHAAGRYREVDGPKVFDFVVSSYTPTLTALLNGKERRTDKTVGKIHLLGVSQPTTPHLSPLPDTKVEIETIQHLHDSRLDLHWLNDKDATRDAVLAHMKKSSWVHLACHGTQNGTQSAFHLADGELTLRDIMRNSLTHADFAVLSACQTAAGDKELPEEAIHLAAGMLMAGYGNVVATMWSIVDSDGPIVTKELYGYLLNEAGGDSGRAAYALHHAVKCLRQVVGETNFVRWVPFIHLGV